MIRGTEGRATIAVVAPNWLGDAVMSLPALATLSSSERVSVCVLSGAYVARVFLRLDGVDDLWIDPPGGRARRVAARVRALRAARPDAVVVLPPSFSSAVPAWAARSRRRVGFRSDGRSWLLEAALDAPGRGEHLSRSYRRLAAAALERLGRPAPDASPRPPRLAVSDAEREAIRARLGERGVDASRYAVVVPGASFGPAKAWPRERYRELCARLARDADVVVVGSAGDREVCERVAANARGVVCMAGGTSLGEFFALLEGARVVVANDSGAPHVAAALGVACVTLFGSTSPEWTAPIGPRVLILQHRVHCNPCFRRTCPTQLECFNGISVERVHDAVVRALSTGGEKAGVAIPARRIESAPMAGHADGEGV